MKSTVLASMLTSAGAAHWAVIMAGSNTYGNYRHQADACHAYQIAKNNGIPASNIIMLAYDDIAGSGSNPFPGKMFNKPTAAGTPGVDVYAGCKIDYKGKDVNAANFLKVLSGDTSASGPVLKSTAKDNVFVYYTDHGGVGILGVPSGAAGGYIHAADINKAIETLQSKGGYKELLFYLEACESGSIFNNLLKAPNAKAITAANAKESSWGWYCAGSGTGGDMVDGKNIGSCLGDEFSVRWMEDTDKASIASETVGQQYTKLVTAVTKSHVMQYGVTSFDSEPIGDFQGNKGQLTATAKIPIDVEGNGVDSRQVEVHQAYFQVMRAETADKRKGAEQELSTILARRHAADTKFATIASVACETANCLAEEMLEGQVETVTHVDCHKASLQSVEAQCGSFTDYSLRYSRLFANLCELGMDQTTMNAAIEKGCGKTVVV
jgi:legumain